MLRPFLILSEAKNQMELIKENAFRKVDTLGRVSIPKGMRDRLEITEGDEMEFFALYVDGEPYICMTNHKGSNNKYEIAAEVLAELGLEVPEVLEEKL